MSTKRGHLQYSLPFFYDMIKPVYRLVFFQTFCVAPLATTDGTGKLFCKSLVFPQLLEDGFMGKIRDILGIIKRRWRGRPLICFLSAAGFTGKYS